MSGRVSFHFKLGRSHWDTIVWNGISKELYSQGDCHFLMRKFYSYERSLFIKQNGSRRKLNDVLCQDQNVEVIGSTLTKYIGISKGQKTELWVELAYGFRKRKALWSSIFQYMPSRTQKWKYLLRCLQDASEIHLRTSGFLFHTCYSFWKLMLGSFKSPHFFFLQ